MAIWYNFFPPGISFFSTCAKVSCFKFYLTKAWLFTTSWLGILSDVLASAFCLWCARADMRWPARYLITRARTEFVPGLSKDGTTPLNGVTVGKKFSSSIQWFPIRAPELLVTLSIWTYAGCLNLVSWLVHGKEQGPWPMQYPSFRSQANLMGIGVLNFARMGLSHGIILYKGIS